MFLIFDTPNTVHYLLVCPHIQIDE